MTLQFSGERVNNLCVIVGTLGYGPLFGLHSNLNGSLGISDNLITLWDESSKNKMAAVLGPIPRRILK